MITNQSLQDNYRIVKKLGTAKKRKFSEVYLLEDKMDSSQLYVLKYAVSELGIQQLKNESDYNFKESYLPQVIEFKEDETSAYLILKYKSGIVLNEYFKQLKAKDRFFECLEFLKRVEPIFAILKEKRIAHLDIKPGNFLVNEETKEIHLIDFGMASPFSTENKRKMVFPLGYAAPELLLNRLHLVDQRTDYFSLAVSIYQLFEGKLPLLDPNPSITTNLQLTHPLTDCSTLDKKANLALQKMAAKHTFKTAPNRLPSDELDYCLKQGIDNRYEDLNEFINDFKQGKLKKSWLFF